MNMMNLPHVLAGLLLLFLGRRLFWLFVGLMGFVAGFAFAERMVHGQPDWVMLAIGIGVGLLGIVIALFLQRIAIAIAGFFSGGYLGMAVAAQLSATPAASEWMFFLIGGILGAILLSIFFDWALIFLSSITGAVLIARALPITHDISMIATLGLFILGFLVQAGWMHHHKRVATET